MNKEYFRCDPLNAVITKQQCELNRNRKYNPVTGVTKILACEGCPGLGEAVEMAKRGDCKCGKKNISLPAGGMCSTCYEASRRKTEKPKKIIIKAIRPSDVLPKVSEHEIHVVNLIEVFKAKQAQDLNTFLEGLSKQSSPYNKIVFALQSVQNCTIRTPNCTEAQP